MAEEAFPLSWPEGWARTPRHLQDEGWRFKTGSGYEYDSTSATGQRYIGKRQVTFDRARQQLADELERLNAKNITLSTNVPLRLAGSRARMRHAVSMIPASPFTSR